MTEQKTVREAREQHDPPMTQEQLADRSGVGQTYISLIERLLRNPSTDIKARLATALEVDPSSLRFAEPLPGSSVDEPYDRTGQADRPTARLTAAERRAEARRTVTTRRVTQRRNAADRRERQS